MQPADTCAPSFALSLQVHLDPLLIRAHSEYNVNLWLLTLAATLATRPVLPHTSALDATARDDIPMAIARGMQRVPWSLEPINEREIGRALYDEEQEVADLCQSEEGRRFWAYLRMQPDRVPEFDPGQWPPGFSRFLPDTQRAWDQIDKCDDLESAHQDRRMQEVLWRRQQQPPAAPASTKPLTGDLARDQGTDSENSMTDKQQEQPQQPEQASGEADSVAGQEQPPTPTQPTKPAKKASLCDRFVCAMERKAGKWKAKAGKAVDFVQAMVGEAVDFITSI